MLKQNRLLALAEKALTAILLVASGACFAQAGYPSKPVKLVVGFAAGGPTDVVARAFADHAARALGQPFVVENKPAPTPSWPRRPWPARRPTATRCCSAPPTTP